MVKGDQTLVKKKKIKRHHILFSRGGPNCENIGNPCNTWMSLKNIVLGSMSTAPKGGQNLGFKFALLINVN